MVRGQVRTGQTCENDFTLYNIYDVFVFVSVLVSVLMPTSPSTSTENERNHQPNLLLYILFIYGRMGCNLGFGGKSVKMLNLIMKIIFKMS